MDEVPYLTLCLGLRTINFNFHLYPVILRGNLKWRITHLWMGSFSILATLSPSASLAHIHVDFEVMGPVFSAELLERTFSNPSWKHVECVLRCSPSTRLTISFSGHEWTASKADLNVVQKALSSLGITQYDVVAPRYSEAYHTSRVTMKGPRA